MMVMKISNVMMITTVIIKQEAEADDDVRPIEGVD